MTRLFGHAPRTEPLPLPAAHARSIRSLPRRARAAELGLDLDRLPPGWLAEQPAGQDGKTPAALRRAIEIVVAVLVLALAGPLLAAASLAARLEGAGPVLERQARLGRFGRPFTLYRLRVRGGGLGRLLRLCRIEDVPQLINVLRGEMALVGPRPEAPEAAAEHARWIPRWREREAVRPGVTGWAQVHQAVSRLDRGGAIAEARRMLGYDLDYVQRRSLRFDLRILLATLQVVLLQEEAR